MRDDEEGRERPPRTWTLEWAGAFRVIQSSGHKPDEGRGPLDFQVGLRVVDDSYAGVTDIARQRVLCVADSQIAPTNSGFAELTEVHGAAVAQMVVARKYS
jgi:hypothetical protein